MSAEPEFLTIAQVRQRLPLARSTLYDLLDRGEIPSITVRCAGGGKRRLIHTAGFERWLEDRLAESKRKAKLAGDAAEIVR